MDTSEKRFLTARGIETQNAISHVFEQKEKFIIIGLTGRIGSGCTTVANFLTKGFGSLELPMPKFGDAVTNAEREYAIIYRFAEKNHWNPFIKIGVRDVITTFLIDGIKAGPDQSFSDSLSSFRTFINKALVRVGKSVIVTEEDLRDIGLNEEGGGIIAQNESFMYFCSNRKTGLDSARFSSSDLFGYLNTSLQNFANDLRNLLIRKGGKDFYTKIYQLFGSNIRSSGRYDQGEFDGKSYTKIAERINDFIKLFERYGAGSASAHERGKVFVVIDSLKNPFEAAYLRDRYSAFYLMALNIDEKTRFSRLNDVKGLGKAEILHADICEYPSEFKALQNSFIFNTDIDTYSNDLNREKEQVLRNYIHFYSDEEIDKEYDIKKYRSPKWSVFTKQDVESCIQAADIHINSSDKVGDFGALKSKILRYISLIMHPGLVLPTDIERCMQIAFSAKINSGCISRQVGAVVTDNQYSLRSIGWNDAPGKVTQCIYRNCDALIRRSDPKAYSDYERGEDQETNSQDFNSYFIECKDAADETKLHGLMPMYCFKDVYCKFSGQGKNQVHTRALHAEERAFLTLISHESARVKGGYLFTTSSPCELCAKKSYELGISKIYYVEPYPGISQSHVFGIGSDEEKPEYILFTGAIGRAYFQIYNPVMPLKDELELRGFNLTSKAARNSPRPIAVDSAVSETGINTEQSSSTKWVAKRPQRREG